MIKSINLSSFVLLCAVILLGACSKPTPILETNTNIKSFYFTDADGNKIEELEVRIENPARAIHVTAPESMKNLRFKPVGETEDPNAMFDVSSDFDGTFGDEMDFGLPYQTVFVIAENTSVVSAYNVIFRYEAKDVDFSSLTLDPESFWNGSDTGLEENFLQVDSLLLTNNYDSQWGSWSGFSYSNLTYDAAAVVPGGSYLQYQYNATTEDGLNGGETYLVGYMSDFGVDSLSFTSSVKLNSITINTNAAQYLTMINGDDFTPAMVVGEDYLKLIIIGYNSSGVEKRRKEVNLLHYGNPTNLFEMTDWTVVDFNDNGGSWQNMQKLEFKFEASEKYYNDYGLIAPTYLAIAGLNYEVETKPTPIEEEEE